MSVAYKYCNLQMGEEQIYSFKIYISCSCSAKILALGGGVYFGVAYLFCEKKKICLLTSSGTQLQSCARKSSKNENQLT